MTDCPLVVERIAKSSPGRRGEGRRCDGALQQVVDFIGEGVCMSEAARCSECQSGCPRAR